MAVTFVGNGAWGTGQGSPLTAPQHDGNTWEFLSRIQDLEAEFAAGGPGIQSITLVGGTTLLITLTDSTTQGPFPLPQLQLTARNEWTNDTVYFYGDLVSVRALGSYLVLAEHTSAAYPEPFDPMAVSDDSAAEPLYFQIGSRAASISGFPYIYTGSVTPVASELNLNAAPDTATLLRIAKTTDGAVNIADLLAAWSSEGRGRIQIIDGGDETNFAHYDIAGTATTSTNFLTFPITHVASSGLFTAGAWLLVQFAPNPGGATDGRTIATTTYTLVLTDQNQYLRCTHGSGCAVTVPSDAVVDFPLWTEIHFRQGTAGPVSFVEQDSDVIINGMDEFSNETGGMGSVATLKKVAADEWDLFGRLASDVSA